MPHRDFVLRTAAGVEVPVQDRTSQISWERLTATDFEHLCFDLLTAMGFRNVDWRRGGTDRGRDIEATWLAEEPGGTVQSQRWFVECKRYLSGGVPVNDLTDKIAWADAERPDYLLIATNSYLLPSAKDWLKHLSKPYNIRVWEGSALTTLLRQFPQLMETFFTSSGSPGSGPRKRRLENDLRCVRDLEHKSGGRVKILRQVGDPPYLYVARLAVKTIEAIRDDKPVWRDTVDVRIALGEDYPASEPRVLVLSPIFHANIRYGHVCMGWGNSRTGLDCFFEGLYQVLSLRSIYLPHPMDHEAAEWFHDNEESVIKEARAANPLVLTVSSQGMELPGDPNRVPMGRVQIKQAK